MLKKRFKLDRCRYNHTILREKKGQVGSRYPLKKSGQVGVARPLKKSGQVTVFIIIGILLLLALVLVVLFRKEVVVFKPEEIIPTEKGKIESYLTGCIGEIGDEALFLVGLHGGYIEVPEEILTDGSQHLKLSPYDVVPYWARGENMRIPSLSEIKKGIDDRIELELRDCLLGEEAFEEAYDIIEKSVIEADTEIVDKKVIFNVHWDLEIRDKAGEVITELIDHTAESPVKLKRAYETARQIVEREMSDLKLEYLTQDLISLEHPKVPVAGLDVSCSKRKWKVAEAREALKDLLRINIRELKIEGTEFAAFPDSLPYYQNHYIWDIGEAHKDISVAFNFDNNYPFLFYVTPQDAGVMKSGMQGGSDMLSFLCLQIWKFTYDVSYPVLVRVRDETTNYNFQIAFTVHLAKNIPDRGVVDARSPSYFMETVTDEDYCKNMNMLMTVYTNELIENNETGVYWREPLEDVDVSFTCLRYRCEMGQTEYDFERRGHAAGFKTYFPYCVGGILRGEKEGYKENWERVVTKMDEEIELDLAPLFKFPAKGLKVVKHEVLSEAGGLIVGEAKELDKETAMIKLVNRREGKVFHELSWAVSPDLDAKIIEESELEFLGKTDFEYEVEIYLFDDEEMKGGYKGNWMVNWEELEEGKEIIFHVLSKETIEDETELFEFMINLEEHSLEVPLPEIK